jgi:hypothetical protein
MKKELANQYVGQLVRICMGNNFVPPPGIITMVTDDSFLFQTATKTSVLNLHELTEINPVDR